MNIAVILPKWIGDVVMATPCLRALRSYYGSGTRITGVMKPYVQNVLAGTNYVDEAIYHLRRGGDPAQRMLGVAAKMRRLKFDTVIVLPNGFSGALLAWLSGAPHRVGYARELRGPLLNHRVTPPRAGGRLIPVAAVDYYLELAYAVGCPPQSKNMTLATLPEHEAIVDRIWKQFDWNGRRVVAFNTGSATGSARDWPAENFVTLARWIIKETDASVLVLCGPGERDTARHIERQVADVRVRSMADQDLGLGVSMAAIRRSQVMVTTDSGPRHIAGAFRVPTVTLSGPIDPRWSHNYQPHDTVLQHAVPCGPCDRTTCPLGHNRCLRDLSVDRVLFAVKQQLGLDRRRQVA